MAETTHQAFLVDRPIWLTLTKLTKPEPEKFDEIRYRPFFDFGIPVIRSSFILTGPGYDPPAEILKDFDRWFIEAKIRHGCDFVSNADRFATFVDDGMKRLGYKRG